MSIRYAHTNIIAENWKTLASFYKNTFSCEEVPPKRQQQGEWIEKGTGVKNAKIEGMHLRLPGFEENGPTLEIYSYQKMEENPSPLANRKGFGHIAFLVDDVQTVAQKVLSNGGSMLGSISESYVTGVGHLTFVYCRDPEGNIIEILNWKK